MTLTTKNKDSFEYISKTVLNEYDRFCETLESHRRSYLLTQKELSELSKVPLHRIQKIKQRQLHRETLALFALIESLGLQLRFFDKSTGELL